jgi:hypothetical protein
MKIQLFVEYSNKHLLLWTPNLKTNRMERIDLRHRLLLDVFLSSGNIFSHCGNPKRIGKIFPNLFQNY